MHADLWAPDAALSKNSEDRSLLNDMCYFKQFVVSNITTETHVEHLAKPFMENVVLSFGMVEILTVDANSWFKSVFKNMCASLLIIY